MTHANVGCDHSRRAGGKARVAANLESRACQSCHSFSPLPEPGSTTQRDAQRCVNERVQQAQGRWERNRNGRCGNVVAKREMLWSFVEKRVETAVIDDLVELTIFDWTIDDLKTERTRLLFNRQ